MIWQPDPTRVTSPSAVAALTVTYSRSVVRSPISTRGAPPLNFKSWVWVPRLAKGNTVQPAPKLVQPSTNTWAIRRVPSPSDTREPTMQYGPISTPSPRVAPESTTAVG